MSIIHLIIRTDMARSPLLTCMGVHRSGGVMIFDSTGKIDINNTLDERLKLLETDALPSVRQILFGENENRKFKD